MLPNFWALAIKAPDRIKNMQFTAFNFFFAPLLAWMAVVSLVVIGYLTSLEFQERRRNRRMNQERHRLGLREV